MECTRILRSICCVLLATSVTSQTPSIDPNANPDRIYFLDDQIAQQALAIRRQIASGLPFVPPPSPIPLGFPPAVQPLPSQIQPAFPQPLPSQVQPVVPQPLPNQPSSPQFTVEPQKILSIEELRDADRVGMARKVIRLDENAAALTNFSINLMKLVSRQSSGNTVVSPHSIATLLALLQQGATGGTLEQLSIALQMSQQSSAAAFKAYSENVKKRSSNNILRTANNIFLADGFTLNPAFRATALRDFRSDVTPTNFIKTAETAEAINQWVAKNTNNMIKNLIAPDSLSVDTQMVLVNAIYFKGLWEVPFRRQATAPGNFRLSNGSIIKAKFMQTRRYFRTGMDPYTVSRVIVLPFEREEYSLMVILPNSITTIADTLSTLTASRLEEYMNYPYLETRLELPKFSIKADTDLSTLLIQMGVSKLFTDSELTNIGTFVDSRPPRVSSAVHSAAFTIDEEGGTATASTAFSVVALSNDEPSVVFIANRPFLAVLWDNKSRLPLFTAKIEDPTK